MLPQIKICEMRKIVENINCEWVESRALIHTEGCTGTFCRVTVRSRHFFGKFCQVFRSSMKFQQFSPSFSFTAPLSPILSPIPSLSFLPISPYPLLSIPPLAPLSSFSSMQLPFTCVFCSLRSTPTPS